VAIVTADVAGRLIKTTGGPIKLLLLPAHEDPTVDQAFRDIERLANSALDINDPNAGSISQVLPGVGDVVGPASSTDNAIARWNGTTGKIIQNSGVLVADNDEITFPAGRILNENTETGALTLDATHDVVHADSDGGAFTVTLPPSHTAGKIYRIKNTGTSGNNITVGRNGNNIESSAADQTLFDLDAVVLISDGTDWWIH